MKIYQLHKYSGEYEDFSDRIIGSYLRKERAEEEKIKAENAEKLKIEHSRRCTNCPLIECSSTDPEYMIKKLLKEHPDFCPDVKLYDISSYIECENYRLHFDEATFEIKEVEVEE